MADSSTSGIGVPQTEDSGTPQQVNDQEISIHKLERQDRIRTDQTESSSQIKIKVAGPLRQCTKSNASKNKTKVTANDLEKLIEQQGYKCSGCGIPVEPSDVELEHDLPRARGGDDALPNLHWLCKVCHKAKGRWTMQEFIDHCRLITLNHRPAAQWQRTV